MSKKSNSTNEHKSREKRLQPLEKANIRDPQIKPLENTQLPGISDEADKKCPPGKVIEDVEKRDPGQRDASDKL